VDERSSKQKKKRGDAESGFQRLTYSQELFKIVEIADKLY
jgi:hypothetical protein